MFINVEFWNLDKITSKLEHSMFIDVKLWKLDVDECRASKSWRSSNPASCSKWTVRHKVGKSNSFPVHEPHPPLFIYLLHCPLFPRIWYQTVLPLVKQSKGNLEKIKFKGNKLVEFSREGNFNVIFNIIFLWRIVIIITIIVIIIVVEIRVTVRVWIFSLDVFF